MIALSLARNNHSVSGRKWKNFLAPLEM